MVPTFCHHTHPSRIVFGAGTSETAMDEVERLGRSRVLLLAAPDAAGDRVADVLGPLVAARLHAGTVEDALTVLRRAAADCVVAVGGATTDLAAELAERTAVDQVVLPTDYSGAELAPLPGGAPRAPDSLPETVIYDVELTVACPAGSAVTALAGAVDALCSPAVDPVVELLALDAITRLGRGLRRLPAEADVVEVRADLLHGAWLAGRSLGAIGAGLHHRLRNALGTSALGRPVDGALLPYELAHHATTAPEAVRRIAAALGVIDPGDLPGAVHELLRAAGVPVLLRELGLAEPDRQQAAFAGAWEGTRPAAADGVRTTRITRAVLDTLTSTADPRLHALLGDLVQRLHAFAVDNDLTQAEWQQGIDFLTRTGQMCSATRQEFVMLSDTLGLSSVVDVVANSRTPESTPSAVLGPFYVEGPPELPQGTDIAAGCVGTPLYVDVRVTDLDGRPFADAVIDVWQSDEDGFYDVQLPDLDGPVLRGRLRTDAEGWLRFWSVLPAAYPLPMDGPVGAMLTATGRHPYRAPHMHFMIDAPGGQRLITQLFVQGGRYLDSDAVFAVKDDLIVDFPLRTGPTPDGREVAGEWRELSFAFRLGADA